MRSTIIRRALAALVIAGVLFLAGLVALPFIASTQIVKDHLALELSRWSGYRVSLAGSPVIRVWPKMQAVLANARFSEWGSNGDSVVLASEMVEIDLSAFAALRGRIEPLRVHFVRPVLRLDADGDRLLLPPAVGGRFRHAMAVATELLAQDGEVARDPSPEPVGTIEVSEGRIVTRSGNADAELVTSLSAMLQWPTINREMNLRASGIWRGENFTINSMLTEPLALLSGQVSPLRVSLDSAPLTGSFAGTMGRHSLSGDIAIASPSLGRALEWVGNEIGTKMPSGPVSLGGSVMGNLRQMKLEKASVTIGGSTGSGTLEFTMRTKVPGITGTLAFEDLDLVQLLTAYSILPGDLAESQLGDLLSLDLRLSATRGAAGPFNLSNLAAVVQVNDRMTSFDISDSAAFGGDLATGFRIEREKGHESAEFRLLANDVEGESLAAATGGSPWVPAAQGKVSVILKGPLAMPQAFAGEANGSITAYFSAGTVGSFSLDSFIARAADGGFFGMDDLEDGSIAFDRAEFKITMTDGVAAIEKATISTPGRLIELGGVADYSRSSIALTGRILSEDENMQPTAFFAGGSWHSPYFSSILPMQGPERP